MRLKIKIKELVPGCTPKILDKGEWIDLYAADTMVIKAAQSDTLKRRGDYKYRDVKTPVVHIPLGIAMKLPKGFEAIVASRSSSPSRFKVFIPNGIGIIDNSYSGNDDQWYYICSPLEDTIINKGERICQFRIQLSQKATFWQKIKWLISSGVTIKKVNNLNNINRGGIGSTGV